MSNFMVGHQCGHTICKMQKIIRKAYQVKKYLWNGTEQDGCVRYMGYEDKVLEILLQYYPQRALTTTTEELYQGRNVQHHEYIFEASKHDYVSDIIVSDGQIYFEVECKSHFTFDAYGKKLNQRRKNLLKWTSAAWSYGHFDTFLFGQAKGRNTPRFEMILRAFANGTFKFYADYVKARDDQSTTGNKTFDEVMQHKFSYNFSTRTRSCQQLK